MTLQERGWLFSPRRRTNARIIYNLVRYGLAYQKKTEDEYAEQHRQRQEKNLHRRAKELGYELKKVVAPPLETAPLLSEGDGVAWVGDGAAWSLTTRKTVAAGDVRQTA